VCHLTIQIRSARGAYYTVAANDELNLVRRLQPELQRSTSDPEADTDRGQPQDYALVRPSHDTQLRIINIAYVLTGVIERIELIEARRRR